MVHIDYPYDLAHQGGTALTDDDDHIRDMIEQVLFTSPGERVNRPDFGCGLLQLVFDPNSPEFAEAIQYALQGALDRWLGDQIEVRRLEVRSVEASLSLILEYTVRRTGVRRSDTFERSL